MNKINVKNLKDRVINLGTRNGHMLCFNPNEVKEVKGEILETWKDMIINYDQVGLLEIQSKEEDKFDLNNDGVFDDKDKSLAGQTLKAKVKRKRKND